MLLLRSHLYQAGARVMAGPDRSPCQAERAARIRPRIRAAAPVYRPAMLLMRWFKSFPPAARLAMALFDWGHHAEMRAERLAETPCRGCLPSLRRGLLSWLTASPQSAPDPTDQAALQRACASIARASSQASLSRNPAPGQAAQPSVQATTRRHSPSPAVMQAVRALDASADRATRRQSPAPGLHSDTMSFAASVDSAVDSIVPDERA